MQKTRLAIFTLDDYVWAFPTWQATLPQLQQAGYEIRGLYLFPEQLGRLKGVAILRWYWQHYGIRDFFLMGLFALKRHIWRLLKPARTWQDLAKTYQIPVYHAATPNQTDVIAWVKEQEIDVVIIMVSQILKQPILAAPRVGLINKHAAVLPSCQGIMPYFWAKLRGYPTGVTFHQVVEQIDAGAILAQKQYPSEEGQLSMVGFYQAVYQMYPEMLLVALENLLAGKSLPSFYEGEPSYFSLPTPAEIDAYKQHHAIIRWSDLWSD